MQDGKGYRYAVSAAGRVNLIGEHVDYCGGKVLPAALSLNNTVYVRPNGENVIRLRWTDLEEEVTLSLDALHTYRGLKYAKYQAGCAYLWQQAGHTLVGCDMLQHCTVPFGSGLSSSAAIEVSTIAALATVAGERFDRVEVARIAQRAEHEYAGVNCGIMDQYISACGREGHAVLLDCKTLHAEYIPVRLGAYELVIANSNKPHALVESRYNERHAETERALALLRPHAPIACLADLTPATLAPLLPLLDQTLARRTRHVVEECERVRLAVAAMKAGDMVRFGALLNASHASMRDLYEVTGSELDALADAARSFPYCIGSRMTGGGFGGCTISLIRTGTRGAFEAHVAERYRAATGYTPSFYHADLSDGIRICEL